MRKILSVVVLLILVAILVTPPIVGHYAKKNIEHELATASFPSGVSVKIVNYDMGWFTSHANLILKYKNNFSTPQFLPVQNISSNKSQQEHTFNFSIKLNHGPLIYTTNLADKKNWFIGQAAITGQSVNFPAPVKIHALMGFNNNFDITYKLAKLHVENAKKDSQAGIDSLTGHIIIANQLTKVKDQTTLNQLELSFNSVKVNVDKITSQASAHKTATGNWIGQRSTTIPKIAISSQNLDLLTFGNITLQSSLKNSPDNKSLDFHYQGILQNISLASAKPFGPLTLKFAMSGINPNALAKLKELFKQAAQQKTTAPNNMSQQFLPFLQQYIDILQGLQLNLSELKLVTPQGNLNVSAKFSFPPQIADSNKANGIALALVLMNMTLNTQGELHVKVPQAFVDFVTQQLRLSQDEVKQKLTDWKTAGILQQQNGNLISNLMYQRGKVFVNKMSLQDVMNKLNILDKNKQKIETEQEDSQTQKVPTTPQQ